MGGRTRGGETKGRRIEAGSLMFRGVCLLTFCVYDTLLSEALVTSLPSILTLKRSQTEYCSVRR